MWHRKSGVGRKGLRDHTASSVTAEFSNTCALAPWRPVTWETGEQELMSLEQRRAGMMGKGALVAIQGTLLDQKTTLLSIHLTPTPGHLLTISCAIVTPKLL